MTLDTPPAVEIRSRMADWTGASDDEYVARFTDAGWKAAENYGFNPDSRPQMDIRLSLFVLSVAYFPEHDVRLWHRRFHYSAEKYIKKMQNNVQVYRQIATADEVNCDISKIEDVLRDLNSLEASVGSLCTPSFRNIGEIINEYLVECDRIATICGAPFTRSTQGIEVIKFLCHEAANALSNYAREYRQRFSDEHMKIFDVAAMKIKFKSPDGFLKALTSKSTNNKSNF